MLEETHNMIPKIDRALDILAYPCISDLAVNINILRSSVLSRIGKVTFYLTATFNVTRKDPQFLYYHHFYFYFFFVFY